jgi:hypothetical protein
MEQHEQNVLDDDFNVRFSTSSSWWTSTVENIPQHLMLLLQPNDHHHHHHNPDYNNHEDHGSFWQSTRFLAAEGDASEESSSYESLRMDYSVLAVGVMTLGLILVVEVLRHKLDYMAMGKPYFTAVLENVYAECTCYLVPVVLHHSFCMASYTFCIFPISCHAMNE